MKPQQTHKEMAGWPSPHRSESGLAMQADQARRRATKWVNEAGAGFNEQPVCSASALCDLTPDAGDERDEDNSSSSQKWGGSI